MFQFLLFMDRYNTKLHRCVALSANELVTLLEWLRDSMAVGVTARDNMCKKFQNSVDPEGNHCMNSRKNHQLW